MSRAAVLCHPPGLKVIFLTEMWERFSYYGMRALLVLYLVDGLGYARADALQLYGLYTGLVYLTPLLGGWMADRYLGKRRAALIGGLTMMLGHLAMAVDGLLQLALGLLIVGNGFFKANTTAMVGELYDGPDDPRRNGGYTLFYMGINLGAFLAPLVAGSLGHWLGWHWGFGVAALGMAVGVLVLWRWQHLLGGAGLLPGQGAVGRADLGTLGLHLAGSVAAVLLLPPLVRLITGQTWPIQGLLGAAALLTSWRLARRASGSGIPVLSAAEWRRVLGIALTALFVVLFWAGYEQAGGSMTLFADRHTDRHLLGGFEFPAAWLLSVAPLLIMLLAPAMAGLLARLDGGRAGRWLPDTAKQALGMLLLALGFVVMAAAQARSESGPVGPHWLLAVYALHTVGELLLSPVGLAMVSRVAPARLAGLLMGLWMLSLAAANYVAGALEAWLQAGGLPLYATLAVVVGAGGLLLLLLTPWLQRLLQAR
ncbi:MAG: peptide MFS transporter [Burkholderiaceae bacterium]|nr:peptide MFS transporter [Burkholderiaceae bacterium]